MLLKNYKQLQTIKNNLILVEDIIPPPHSKLQNDPVNNDQRLT